MKKKRTHTGTRKISIYDKMFDKEFLMQAYRGSKAHNLYASPDEPWSTDDIDLITVYRFPIQYYLTLEGYHKRKETYELMKGAIDEVGYEIRKMFDMLRGMNPNVINTLYLRKEDYIETSPAWEMIIENRDIFVSKDLILNRFGGYARSQMKRMEESSTKGYKGRLGEKRKQIVKKIGYDTKNASHLIRLLRMGIEFLRDGQPVIFRTDDREELLSIKRGDWKLKDIQKLADETFLEMNKAYSSSSLPSTLSMTDINKLLYEVMVIK